MRGGSEGEVGNGMYWFFSPEKRTEEKIEGVLFLASRFCERYDRNKDKNENENEVG